MLRCLALSIMLFGQLSPIAFAATAQIDRHGDWELICREPLPEMVASESEDTVADYSGARCRLQQAQAITGSKDVAFLLNFVMQKERTLAIISTPLNVYLPAGLDLKVDAGKTRRAMFETCNLAGCHSGFVVDQTMLSGFRVGKSLVVTVRNSKSTQIPIHVSLKGISNGLDALKATQE